MTYRYVTTYRQDGRTYAHTFHYPPEATAQASREHTASMRFHWCEGTDGIVSALYNQRGDIVRHGAHQHQPRPDTYSAVPMPADIAARLAAW